MSPVLLTCDLASGVRLLQLNRPEKRQALNEALMAALVAAVDAADADGGVRAVVLTGDQRAFCAGADVTEMSANNVAVVGTRGTESLWGKLQRFTKPLIAAVAGVAFGGGLELALLCDLIVLGDNARIGQPEVRIGAMPGGGATQRLPRLIGRQLATLMLLTGEEIDASRALRAGLAVQVVTPERVVEQAVAIAARIAANAPLAVRAVKAAISASEGTLADGLILERRLHDEVFASEDRREGMEAFLAKRPPCFRAR